MLIVVSAVCLVPCFWHPQIEAGDLASHTYNAWLTSLVRQGKTPGLWIAPQTYNILFDILLDRLGSVVGYSAGEKTAACVAVLVFLWGSFALVSAGGGKAAWFLLPLVIMLTYGWTLQMGFFNFYLSMGLSCAGLAILWRARGAGYLWLMPFAALIWTAHPLGAAWFVATGLYIFTAKFVRPPVQWFLPIAALGVVFLVRLYLTAHYQVLWRATPFYTLNGSDQLILGSRYWFLALSVLLVVAGCVLLHLAQVRDEGTTNYFPLPVQLFVVCFLGVCLLPHTIWVPPYADPVALITSRFTLATAIFGCVALAGLRSRIPLAVLTGAIALAYFSFLYQDTGKTYAMERQAERLVNQLPQNGRVIATIFPFRNSRIFVHHVVDRACIGRCFVIDNYEASSGQFRLRANPGSRIVSASNEDTNRMLLGDYVVKPEDLPLWQMFRCGPLEFDLCLRPLRAGPLRDVSAQGVVRAREQRP